MLLRLWQNILQLEKALSDYNTYRMYSTIVTEGLNFALVEPDSTTYSDQPLLDIEQIRILPMSHKYKPSSMHAGLLIYSVDGETDFILNDALLRIKTGDILIQQIHHALSGEDDIDVYRDLIQTLFGTHRINLIGLVFTFSGSGRFTNCKKWTPVSSQHTTPAHPTEQKLLEIALVTLYMNDVWFSMPLAVHSDIETLSRSAKKQYLLKLGDIEQLYNKRRQEQGKSPYGPLPNLLKLTHHHPKDDFRSFEWTANRQQAFDETVQSLFDQLYNQIQQIFEDGEFDSNQYVYYDDSTKQLFSNLAKQTVQPNEPPAYSIPTYAFLQQPQAYSAQTYESSKQTPAYSAPVYRQSQPPQAYSAQAYSLPPRNYY